MLTAASCTYNLYPGYFTVRTGSTSNRAGTEHQVAQLQNHPQFGFESRRNDIALVQTTRTIATNANSRPIALARTETGATAGAVVVGWGRSDVSVGTNAAAVHCIDHMLFAQINSAVKSSVQQFLNTNTISNANCREGLRSSGYESYVLPTNVCALTQAGQGICRADSGSPLAVDNELIGVASFGVSCATGVPDVFTRVHPYSDWIALTAV